MFLAHIREIDHAKQTVQEHLEEVSLLARAYGEPSGIGAHAELAGFLHDLGKFTEAFTIYLTNAVFHHDVATKKIDHSTAGAKYLYEQFYDGDGMQKLVVETVGMAILSHHSGLQNFAQLDFEMSDYVRRVKKDLPYYDEVIANFEAIKGNKERVQRLIDEATKECRIFFEKISAKEHMSVYFSYLQKLVFSCLIDADRTNTRCFEENQPPVISDYTQVFSDGYRQLMKQVEGWKENKEPINQLRTKMSENCDLLAGNPSAIYTLSIPTGGGKTFASLRYALKHAKEYKKSRIIYVVPYTTILEQNAQAVREIIRQQEAILEHHANVIDDEKLDTEEDFYGIPHHKKMQLGRDNWDYPIIFTTMVQFLDAFFQKGTRKSRRLHNLTNSVVIFDEVQAVPYKHFSLFNTALNFLHYIGNSSLVLCTATQPTVGAMKYAIELQEYAEMVPQLTNVVKAFERVTVHNHVTAEGYDAGELAMFMQNIMEQRYSVLVILNTKTAVRKLYEELAKTVECKVYHLSTSMCPAHRSEILKEINQQLGKEPIICVSSQLIEAGVDISFEVVVRSLAGLDSIAQAAGRCNRHKEREKGDVYIVRAKDENLRNLPEIAVGGEVTANYILRDERYAADILSPSAIYHYFRHYDNHVKMKIKLTPDKLKYELINLLEVGIQSSMRENASYALFKTLEQYFQAIESNTKVAIVPFGKGKEIITELNEKLTDITTFNHLLKTAQQFSVNLYEYQFRLLSQQGLLKPLYHESLYYLDDKAYSTAFGVSIEGEEKMEDYSAY
ncbi:CRISPR-associated helicase Cas3' [Metasolibacillus meyeri]|uniref:CRISPR-associated helicase Cas3 n=1 Tax=Metasolibacillus meyeri TaxID=1071052 RepID=A0AAW9NNN8_9BACL|nr:CRISPR-associated helicase Cas3' [Metasolibacillus meyeri]MEC1177373.1 CRISPR-associated helicase Cas3' [Metasolibacillus meyeri]